MNYKDAIKDKKIVFVSGVFDILHEGHKAFLKGAKDLVKDQGVLLVAVHDDASVKEKKGDDRPYNKLDIRLKNLEELKIADVVIPWHGWKTIVDFVKELRPNYIAISEGDPHQDRKQQIADEIGAELKIVTPHLEGHSTSKILNSMKSD